MGRPQLNTVTLDFYANAAGQFVVDCARALSLYNRRSYRSGYVYSIDYIEYIGSASDTITIGKIPESYSVLNAYRLGYEQWKQQRSETIDQSGLRPGRWSDFKVWMSEDHYDQTYTELLPRGLDGLTLTLQPLDITGAEWNRAEIVFNDLAAATTTTVNVGMLGNDNVPFGYGSLLTAYGDTTVATQAPDPLNPQMASSSWITRTGEQSAEMAEDIVDLIEDENDLPPYANQTGVGLSPTYVGNDQSAPHGLMVDQGVTGSTGRAISLNGGLFPCGLMAIATGGSGPFTLRVHMTRGTYKGVAAKSMGSFS